MLETPNTTNTCTSLPKRLTGHSAACTVLMAVRERHINSIALICLHDHVRSLCPGQCTGCEYCHWLTAIDAASQTPFALLLLSRFLCASAFFREHNARYSIRPYVCLLVCPAVGPSYVGIVWKRLNIPTKFVQCWVLPSFYSFLWPDLFTKFGRSHPNGGFKYKKGMKSPRFWHSFIRLFL